MKVCSQSLEDASWLPLATNWNSDGNQDLLKALSGVNQLKTPRAVRDR